MRFSRVRRSLHARVGVLVAGALCLALGLPVTAAVEQGFVRYTDPQRRFTFDYPATMKVEASNADEIKVSHPEATLRITVFIEKRPPKSAAKAEDLVAVFKVRLKEEMQEVAIISEGKLPEVKGSQAFVICSFKNRKGMHFVQLVQYYVTDERILQMTISDLPRGFRNLMEVIGKIHESLRIMNPKLK